MVRLVDATHPNLAILEVDFIEAAWALFYSPIGRQRQVHELSQQRAVDAIMADDHDRIVAVVGEHEAQRVGNARGEVL